MAARTLCALPPNAAVLWHARDGGAGQLCLGRRAVGRDDLVENGHLGLISSYRGGNGEWQYPASSDR